ncbi:hypothetical protein [Hymenobacter cellulosilyticus]|uniref:Uncharacterized protein n=1 Tax=Hymenobacter cellulosilyticus TaxID=2932248 RepID=A0A8T9Q678_9BACT|nr:hypothetical protein [Hymenobacter cellulosilyticus]UOQ70959.1 hypothetical protein MUN79_20110 [Hymenobacter cellulosilyticus]
MHNALHLDYTPHYYLMQRFLPLLFLLGSLCMPVYGQTTYLHGQVPPSYLQFAFEATLITHPLILVAHLNEAEYLRLRAAQERLLTRRDQVLHAYAPESPLREPQLYKVQLQFELERQRALSPSQLSLLPDQQRDLLPLPEGNGLGWQLRDPDGDALSEPVAFSSEPVTVAEPILLEK